MGRAVHRARRGALVKIACPVCGCWKDIDETRPDGLCSIRHGNCGCTRDGLTFLVCPCRCPTHNNKNCGAEPAPGHKHWCVRCHRDHQEGKHVAVTDWCVMGGCRATIAP